MYEYSYIYYMLQLFSFCYVKSLKSKISNVFFLILKIYNLNFLKLYMTLYDIIYWWVVFSLQGLLGNSNPDYEISAAFFP